MKTTSQPLENIRGLRWKLEYVDKPPRGGGWDYTGDDPLLQAWRQPREGLLFAVIEAKDHNQIIHRVFECNGQDFCNFQWEAEASVSLNGKVGQHRQVGLTLVSRSERATIFRNGFCQVIQRQADDLDNHFSYGKV